MKHVRQRKTNIIDFTRTWNLTLKKKYINELIYNTEVDLQISKINLWSPKGKYKDKG